MHLLVWFLGYYYRCEEDPHPQNVWLDIPNADDIVIDPSSCRAPMLHLNYAIESYMLEWKYFDKARQPLYSWCARFVAEHGSTAPWLSCLNGSIKSLKWTTPGYALSSRVVKEICNGLKTIKSALRIRCVTMLMESLGTVA